MKLVFFQKNPRLSTCLLQVLYSDSKLKIQIFEYHLVSKIFESEYSRFEGKDSNPNLNPKNLFIFVLVGTIVTYTCSSDGVSGLGRVMCLSVAPSNI